MYMRLASSCWSRSKVNAHRLFTDHNQQHLLMHRLAGSRNSALEKYATQVALTTLWSQCSWISSSKKFAAMTLSVDAYHEEAAGFALL